MNIVSARRTPSTMAIARILSFDWLSRALYHTGSMHDLFVYRTINAGELTGMNASDGLNAVILYVTKETSTILTVNLTSVHLDLKCDATGPCPYANPAKSRQMEH